MPAHYVTNLNIVVVGFVVVVVLVVVGLVGVVVVLVVVVAAVGLVGVVVVLVVVVAVVGLVVRFLPIGPNSPPRFERRRLVQLLRRSLVCRCLVQGLYWRIVQIVQVRIVQIAQVRPSIDTRL